MAGNDSKGLVTVGYRSGKLYAYNKAGKSGTTPGWRGYLVKKAKDFTKGVTSVVTGGAFDDTIFSIDENRGNFQRAHISRMVEGRYNYEVFPSKTGDEPPAPQSKLILVGSFVYPFIKSNTSGEIVQGVRTTTSRDPGFAGAGGTIGGIVGGGLGALAGPLGAGIGSALGTGLGGMLGDDVNLVETTEPTTCGIKDARFTVPTYTHSKHFLQKHTYQRLQAFGDDFAKWHGLEPMDNGDWGVKWSVDILCHVGWRFVVRWDSELLYYDGMVKEDLRPNDDSMESFVLVQQIAKLVLAAATGGMGVAGAAITGAADVQANANYTDMMQNQTYADSGRKHGLHVNDIVRMSGALDREKEGNETAWNNAKEGWNEAWGQTQSYRIPRLMMGGRAKFQSGINDWIEKEGRNAPLTAAMYSSEHYDTLWRQTMNEHLLNFYFPFAGDKEISLKEGIGTESGLGKEILNKIHGFIKFSGINFWGTGNPNSLFTFWCKNDIFVYQKNEHRPCRTIADDFYPGFSANFSLNTANQQGVGELHTWTTNRTRMVENFDSVSGSYLYAAIWCSDDNISLPIGRRGPFETYDSTARKDIWTGLFATGDGTVGDPACGGRERWDGTMINGKKSEKYPDGWTESNISPFKGKPFRTVRWGRNLTGVYQFGFGAKGNTVVTRYMRGKKQEEEIWTKSDDETWVIKRRSDYPNVMVLGKVKEIEEQIQHRTSEDYNPLNITIDVTAVGFSGLEGFDDSAPNLFGGGGNTGSGGIPQPLTSGSVSIGGIATFIPDTNPLSIDTTLSETAIQQSTLVPDLNISIKLPEAHQIPVSTGFHEHVGVDTGIQQDLHADEKIKEKGREKIKEKT